MKTEKHFLKSSQQIRIYAISFRSIVSLSQKKLALLKNVQKTEKMSFSNAENIRFWAQGSFKTIF